MAVALFQDATANALASSISTVTPNAAAVALPILMFLYHDMVAGTTSSTTFKMRAGQAAANTYTFNGVGGVRRHGGVASSYLKIVEVFV